MTMEPKIGYADHLRATDLSTMLLKGKSSPNIQDIRSLVVRKKETCSMLLRYVAHTIHGRRSSINFIFR